MNEEMKIKKAIRSIGLALNASNGVIATDDISKTVDEKSWRIDHSSEIAALDYLENLLLNSTDICPLCGHRNNSL